MNISLRSLLAALALVCLSACMTVPAARPSLAGAWHFRIDTGGGRITLGQLSLTPAAGGYTGSLTTNRGDNVLPVRSFTVDGRAVRMHVESPQGAVTFAGDLAPGSRAFAGTVTYHDGRRFTLRATKD
ncbi:MAG TPA: hypothetical protein VEC11_08075 [Allosphingosinicella sp.]|nr:hypothetical protein [Allosphingosinicella sp.]